MNRLSIIIPAYNELETVMRCVNSVAKTIAYDRAEILVQDDASPDVVLPDVIGDICQRNVVNVGFPGNCNIGAQRARGDVLLFLNQDIVVTQRGWYLRLLDAFQRYPQAGVMGPTLLFPSGNVQSVGGSFDVAGHPFHVALGATNPDWLPIATPRPVKWITGAAFAVRKDLWVQLGGFEEGYLGGYFEDVDFCLRARTLGWEVWHQPNIRMTHYVGTTGGNRRFMQNALLFKDRWAGNPLLETTETQLRERWWA